MRKILVTGAAGFIGKNLCESLLKNSNHQVIGIDNYLSGSKENIRILEKYENFRFICHDVKERLDLDVEIDEIYNAACPASPRFYQESPTDTIKTCVLGAINMLDLAKKNHARILQFSTSEIYGNPLIHPQREEYWGNVNPIGIRSCYDEGKRAAETLFMDYHREYGVDIRIIRIFNTYGPYMRRNDGRVVSNFIMQALKNEDITIYGDGTQTRSFMYIDDLIEGIKKVMEHEYIGSINLGNPNERTIRELAERIIEMTKSKSKIIYYDLPQDDPIRRKPDIERAKGFGWEPKVSLTEGLLQTIEYFKNS